MVPVTRTFNEIASTYLLTRLKAIPAEESQIKSKENSKKQVSCKDVPKENEDIVTKSSVGSQLTLGTSEPRLGYLSKLMDFTTVQIFTDWRDALKYIYKIALSHIR